MFGRSVWCLERVWRVSGLIGSYLDGVYEVLVQHGVYPELNSSKYFLASLATKWHDCAFM